MLSVTVICVGNLKEAYLRDAVKEYEKRLAAYCRFKTLELKDGTPILPHLPERAYRVALCVEGKQLSSEELADKLNDVSATHGEICIVIGSSFGLDDSVKNAGDMRLSVSKLTFPHQLMRVILLEAIYRGFNILKGTHYHK